MVKKWKEQKKVQVWGKLVIKNDISTVEEKQLAVIGKKTKISP